MTQAEIEASLKRITENQVVQGELLHRLELAVDRNTEAIAQLAGGMQVMQAAMHRLFEHMDRFIQGLEGDGHRPV
ncbi:MAG: hypothetical protein ACRD2B_09820 [Terriglobia bacterium]